MEMNRAGQNHFIYTVYIYSVLAGTPSNIYGHTRCTYTVLANPEMNKVHNGFVNYTKLWPKQRGPKQRGPKQRGPKQRGPKQRGPKQRGPKQRGLGSGNVGQATWAWLKQRGPKQRGPSNVGPSNVGQATWAWLKQRGPKHMGLAQAACQARSTDSFQEKWVADATGLFNV